MRNATQEPLLEELLTYVSHDEARHTGFGIQHLKREVPRLPDAERAALEDFAFEAARNLLDSRRAGTLRESVLALWKDAGLDPIGALGAIAKERETVAAARARSWRSTAGAARLGDAAGAAVVRAVRSGSACGSPP